jgi:hypothetical protein
MRKAISAAVVACFALGSFAAAPAMADSVVIKVKPRYPVVKRVVVTRQPCYYKTVKTITNRKTVIVKKRVCP